MLIDYYYRNEFPWIKEEDIQSHVRQMREHESTMEMLNPEALREWELLEFEARLDRGSLTNPVYKLSFEDFYYKVLQIATIATECKTEADFELIKQIWFGCFSEHCKFILTENQVNALVRLTWRLKYSDDHLAYC